VIPTLIDIQYGGEQGLQEALAKSRELFVNLEYMHEQKVVELYFEEINKGNEMYTYGVVDTMYAFEAGAIEKLLVWNDLPYYRFNVRNTITGDNQIFYKFKDEEIGQDFELVEEPKSLLEWIMDNYENFNTLLEIVTSNSPEGNQFCLGFSGIGSLLRFSLDLPSQMDPLDFDQNESSECEWDW